MLRLEFVVASPVGGVIRICLMTGVRNALWKMRRGNGKLKAGSLVAVWVISTGTRKKLVLKCGLGNSPIRKYE